MDEVNQDNENTQRARSSTSGSATTENVREVLALTKSTKQQLKHQVVDIIAQVLA